MSIDSTCAVKLATHCNRRGGGSLEVGESSRVKGWGEKGDEEIGSGGGGGGDGGKGTGGWWENRMGEKG